MTGFSLEQGLPGNVMAERAVLGGILLDNVHYPEAAAALQPDDFTLESNRRIFRRMVDLGESGRAIDLVTLVEELGRQREVEGVGGVAYITSLTDSVPRRSSLEHHIAIVRDKARRRRLIASGEAILQQAIAPEETTDDIVASAQARLLELGDARGGAGLRSVPEIVEGSFGGIQAMFERGHRISGIETFYPQFDEMTAGLQRQDLVIVAARPSMGKTAWACDVAANVALRAGGVVGIFSLEMSKEALISRLLCSQARVDSHRFRKGIFSPEERERILAAYARLEESRIHIDDTAAIGLPEMRLRARRLQMKFQKLDLVVVDYLQLMTPPLSTRRAHGNREQEVAAISRGLKALAKELDCPVMGLAQLSRAPEVRSGDHRPILSDLRDSGGIEQDADIVAFLYREEVYKPRDEELQGVAELIIAKQRNGPTGMMRLAFLRSYAHFEAGALEREPGED